MLLAALACAAVLLPAHAHKASDAYLQLKALPAGAGVELRWDVALRDLDEELDLDADADGQLTWGEIRTAWPAIETHALQHVRLQGCTLSPSARGLEQRSDGAYAVLWLRSTCRMPAEPVMHYSFMRELDPTHRGLLKIEREGRPAEVIVLEPKLSSAGQGDAAGATPGQRPPASVSTSFLREGVRHILTGYDHVLFLLCLLLPAVMRRTPSGWQPVERLGQAVWPVAGIVTAFTVAHSLTLALAALKLASLPSRFIEPAVAVTIIVAALDNLRPLFGGRRVIVTFLFGLIHGFGFAGVLGELDLPATSFAWALLRFNLGLEVGQLAIVFAVTAVLYLLRRRPIYPAWVIRGGSCGAIVVGMFWLAERTLNVSLLPV
jgi:hypothetical protein